MKQLKYILSALLAAAAVMLLGGCSLAAMSAENPAGRETNLPDTVLDSYYAAQDTPAFEYFHHERIQEFLGMWVLEETGDIADPKWDYDSFARIIVMDHDLSVSRPDEQLYCLTFTDGTGRCGYVIVKYDASGPSISNWSVTETTPYQYDLKANGDTISESLSDTDIDLKTASASRVYLFDQKNKRADQVILFTDGKKDTYICYLGNDSLEVKKWQ